MIRSMLLVQLVAALSFSGCLELGPARSPSPTSAVESACVEILPITYTGYCLVNRTSAEYELLATRYGLHEVSIQALPPKTAVEGDLIAWSVAYGDVIDTSEIYGGVGIYAYNTTTHRYHSVAVENHVRNVSPHLSQGRIAYTQYRDPEPGRPFIWDSRTNETVAVQTGFQGGEQSALDYDGTWLLLGVRGSSPSEDGIWGLRIADGHKVFVYKSGESKDPEGAYRDGRLVNGHAYIGILRYDRSGSKWNTSFMDGDLVKETTSTLGRFEQAQVNQLDVSRHHIVWERGDSDHTSIWGTDLRTRESQQLGSSDAESSTFPAAGGDWAVYTSHESGNLNCEAVHLPTMQRIVIVQGTIDSRGETPSLTCNGYAGVLATDGVSFVAAVGYSRQGDPWGLADRVVWGRLPIVNE